MKKLFLIALMLTALSVVGIAQTGDRTGTISKGKTKLSQPMAFTTSDYLEANDTVNIEISNKQDYYQHQTFTTQLDSVSGTPSVEIKAWGKVSSSGSWVQISDSSVWTSSANNPVTITSTAPANYNYLKLEYVASGTTQKVKITSFDLSTSHAYEVSSNAGTVTFSRATSGTVTLTSADNNADAALTIAAGGTGALTIGDTGSGTTVTSSGTVAITGSNVEIGATSANETTPSLKIIGDADSDAAGDTDETLTIDLSANATPTSAVWDITSTQSAGYRFDKSLSVGPATADDVQPTFKVQGDADSDAGGDTQEALTFTLTPNATPTSAYWKLTSTQAAGIAVVGSLGHAIAGGTPVISAGLLGGAGTATNASQTLGAAGGKAFSYYLSSTSTSASDVLTGYYMNVNYGVTGGASAAPSGDAIRGRAYLMGDAAGSSAVTGGAFTVELEATTASNTGLTAGARGNIVLPNGVMTNAGTYYGTMAEVYLSGNAVNTTAYTEIAPLGIVVGGTAPTAASQLSNMVAMAIRVPANMITDDGTMVVTGATGAVGAGLKISINGTPYWIMLATADE